MNLSLNKKYNFDIDATVNTYAGELALPYVTAALLGAETIAKFPLEIGAIHFLARACKSNSLYRAPGTVERPLPRSGGDRPPRRRPRRAPRPDEC